MKLIHCLPFFLVLISFLSCQKPTDAVIPTNLPPAGQVGTSTGTSTSTGTPTEIGQPTGIVTTQTVGPAGGTITLPDGSLTLNFPAGAVSKETVITIQPIENKAHLGAGKAYHFGPDGTQFAKPITMTWHYKPEDMNGSTPEALAIAFQDKQGVWMRNYTVQVNKTTQTVSAQLPHFSDWSFVFEYEILSTAGTMDGTVYLAAAESAKIYIMTTHDSQNDIHKDSYWAMDKPYVMSAKDIIAWRLNGKTENNYAEEGQIITDPNYAQVLYSAPPRKPAVNPVAVSAEIDVKEKGKLILVEYVSVEPYASVTIDGSTDNNPNVELTLFGNSLYGAITDATGTKLSLSFTIKNFHGNGTYAVDKEHTTTLIGMQPGNVPYSDYYTEYPSAKWVSGGGKIIISGYDIDSNVMKGEISGTLFLYKDINPIPKVVAAVFRGRAISTQVPPMPGLGG